MPTKDRADIRIGKLEKKLGLGKGAIRNPDGTDARSDKKLGTLREEYRSLYGSLPVRKNAGIIAAAAAKPKAAVSKKKSVAKAASKPAASGTAKKASTTPAKKATPKAAKPAAIKAPAAKKASPAAPKKAGTATKGKK